METGRLRGRVGLEHHDRPCRPVERCNGITTRARQRARVCPSEYLRDFDVSRGELLLTAVSRPTYSISVQDLIHVGSTDLARFNKRGGKLLIVHGVSDPIFSVNDTLAWWNDLNTSSGAMAGDFARVFAVPGMQHCAGGPATDQFDIRGFGELGGEG